MREAFEDIVRQYQSPIRRFFLHQTLGDSQLSDDLAQDTFVKAFTHYSSFRGDATVQTWLMRIAYNVFYDYTRKKRAEMSDEGLERATATGSGTALTTSPSPISTKLDLDTALSVLKADERSCITLQFVDGYDIAAIARITGLKEGTVKSHLSRGKEKLATYLRNNGYGR